MKTFYRVFVLLTLFIILFQENAWSQPCGINTPSFNVNLTGFPNGNWTSPNVVRNDQCCGVVPPDRCVEFWVTLDPGAVGIRFDISSGAIPPGALYYQLNCANPTQVGDTMCISGVGPHRITFCKPGNNQNTYTITSIPAPSTGPPTVAQDGCSGTFTTSGFDESTIVWNSLSPGPFGSYNNYLNCTTACDTVIVTALPGYPPSILYQVCGLPMGACASQMVCDTVRVYFVSTKSATIQPQNPVICFGGPPATLTANGTGGAPPYSYLWSTGATTQQIVVGAGTYWVQISDTTNCPPVYDTVTVVANPSLISCNAGPNDTACSYNASFSLNANVVVATGGIWSGGSGTFNPNNTTLNATYTPSAGEISAGTVTLMLITTGNGPCPADTDYVTLTIWQPPTAAFTSTNPCSGQPVFFTDNSTVSPGSIVAWNWNFGDAGTSTLQNPSHVYASPGTYLVTLVVTSSNGCVDTIQQNVVVNPLPVAAFNHTAQCYVDSVFFTDVTTISSGSITSWSWNFGDPPSGPNNTSTLQNPSHYYNTPGSYTVTLIVTSNLGCSDTIITNLTVNPSPAAAFSFNNVCLGNPTVFTDNSTISTGSIVSWNWNFGDASTSTLQNPTHTYAAPGTYTVTLIVTSAIGCIDTLQQLVTVHPLPAAAFSHNAQCNGYNVTFTDNSTISSGSITGWSWNFGDANTSTLQNPSHLYATFGTYTVTLTVTSVFGCTATTTQTVTIYPTPVAAFTAGNACLNVPISFTDNSTIATGIITGWSWNFGDANTSTQQNPVHVYATPGTYTVTLIVTSGNGCSDTIQQPVTVHPLPVAAFTTTNACLNQVIGFTDNSTISTGSITGWSWNFGDAGTSNLQNPSHSYASAGTYTVTLIVYSGFGCSDTIQQNLTIHPMPSAAFNHNGMCYVDTVDFTDLSTILTGNITGWTWDFGDPSSGLNNVSTLQNPSHFFTSPGNYTVTLIVTSGFGCTDTITTNITINPSPVAVFNATEVCHGSITTFSDSSYVSPGSIVSWNWNFGDASSSSLQNPTHNYLSPGSYTVSLVVTSATGCVDTLTQTIIVHPNPVAAFSTLGFCLADGIPFTDQSTILAPDSIVSWFWDFGDATTGTQQNPLHYYPATGTYGAILIVTSNFGCMDTILQAVTVNPSPTASFSTDLTIAVINQTVNFTDQSSGAITWFWDFGDGSGTSTAQNPSYSYAQGGTYTVTLVVTNQFGCTDTSTYEIIVTMPPQVPSGFSPNGDGQNDVLFVLGGPYKEMEFRIYNNWGELIFVSTNQGNGWDGTRSGMKQPMSVYIYTLFAITEDDKEHNLKGDVTLLR